MMCIISLNALAISGLDDEFDGDFCQDGYAAPWVSACVCNNPIAYTGKYCDTPTTTSCKTNSECSKDAFCLTLDDSGKCAPVKERGPITINKNDFVLSDMLLNYQSAVRFCNALGGGYRQAERADFSCTDIGPLCLDINTVISLQEPLGTKGFFWLDSKDNDIAYYADINDGTVYETSKQNIKTIQALCIKKGK
jgi:hypothetical protein